MKIHISQIMKQNETNISAISESTPESQPMNQTSLLTCLYFSIKYFDIRNIWQYCSDSFRCVTLFIYLSGIKILFPAWRTMFVIIQHTVFIYWNTQRIIINNKTIFYILGYKEYPVTISYCFGLVKQSYRVCFQNI